MADARFRDLQRRTGDDPAAQAALLAHAQRIGLPLVDYLLDEVLTFRGGGNGRVHVVGPRFFGKEPWDAELHAEVPPIEDQSPGARRHLYTGDRPGSRTRRSPSPSSGPVCGATLGTDTGEARFLVMTGPGHDDATCLACLKRTGWDTDRARGYRIRQAMRARLGPYVAALGTTCWAAVRVGAELAYRDVASTLPGRPCGVCFPRAFKWIRKHGAKSLRRAQQHALRTLGPWEGGGERQVERFEQPPGPHKFQGERRSIMGSRPVRSNLINMGQMLAGEEEDQFRDDVRCLLCWRRAPGRTVAARKTLMPCPVGSGPRR